jgi:rhodanese-related sulfurtransferase
MPASETITVLAKYKKPEHHLLVLNKADAPFLIDLRPEESYLNKHVVGSVNIPFPTLLLHKDQLKNLDKVIILAEPKALAEAEEAYLVLTALGFKQVFVVPNGLVVCKMAKLSFTTLTDARVQAFSAWFTAMPKQEKVPTVAGVAFILLSLFAGKRKGIVFGVGSTLLGYGLRNQLKTEQASSVGQWVLKILLKKLV